MNPCIGSLLVTLFMVSVPCGYYDDNGNCVCYDISIWLLELLAREDEAVLIGEGFLPCLGYISLI